MQKEGRDQNFENINFFKVAANLFFNFPKAPAGCQSVYFPKIFVLMDLVQFWLDMVWRMTLKVLFFGKFFILITHSVTFLGLTIMAFYYIVAVTGESCIWSHLWISCGVADHRIDEKYTTEYQNLDEYF